MNKFGRVIRYLLPALPFVCLGVGLLLVASQIDLRQSLEPTQNPDQLTPTDISRIGESIIITSTLPLTTTLPLSSATSVDNKNINSTGQVEFLNVFKDVSLVVAAGMITLSSAYIGALVQSILKEEEESRTERKKRTKPYRDYFNYLLHLGQRASLVKRHDGLLTILQNAGKDRVEYEISDKTIVRILDEMPLAWELSSLDNPETRDAVNTAMNVCINFLMDIREENSIDYDHVRKVYLDALEALDKYDRM